MWVTGTRGWGPAHGASRPARCSPMPSGIGEQRAGHAAWCMPSPLRTPNPHQASRVRAMSRFTDALNEQIAYEFGASQQYVAIAVHYDAQTLPQLAAHFYRQAVEERNHAMMMVQYLLDADERVRIPGVETPQTDFAEARAPVALALEQERRVTDQIVKLVELAREEGNL